MNFKVPPTHPKRNLPRYRSTKELRRIANDNFTLPGISCKIGSLHSFLIIEEFRKKLPVAPDEVKFAPGSPLKAKKLHKLYLTMNEELSSNNKKEVSNNIVGIDDQAESIDERKKLLYDKHVINRQKAAINICKSIVDEVKYRFGYKINIDEESSDKESEYSEENVITLNKLIKPAEKCSKFEEKLEKISELSNKFFQQSSLRPANGRKSANNNSLAPGEPEGFLSRESSVQRTKGREKASKEDLFSVQVHVDELFSETPLWISTYKTLSSAHDSLVFPSNIDISACFSHIVKCSEIPLSKQKPAKQKKNQITLNRSCLYLPDCNIDNKLCKYICYFYQCFQGLLKLDLSSNAIGDKTGAFLIEVLSLNSPVLDSLDLSRTGLGTQACEALKNYLTSPDSRLQALRIQNNLLLDEGICCLAVGLLVNTTLVYLNLSSCGFELASGLAFAKVLRINRGLRALVVAQSMVSGRAIREMCRSLIINKYVVSVNAAACRLIDEDAKEIAHMLNSNTKLQQLILVQNKISKKGLGYLSDGIMKNKALVHLGLSGNSKLKLKALEKMKESLQKHVDVDISKEEDFLKSDEARKFKLIEYFRYEGLKDLR